MDRKLQVFVSSTFTDLVDERQAAVSAILKAGHMPAGMELFTAGNKSQWDTITKWIDESDVYMLILGGRYGSVETISGLSYTELEYDYALKAEKPFFSIVAKDEAIEEKVKVHGRAVIEQDNPPKLKTFRHKVLSSMSTFFEDEKDIRLAVMESLMQLSDIHANAGWVKASSLVDTRSLDETIVRLRDENTQLDATVKKLQATAKAKNPDMDDYEALKKVLSNTLVSMTPGNDPTAQRSVLQISVAYLDWLVRGIQSNASNDTSTWLYSSVFPKLVLHGLAKVEKPSGSVFYQIAQLNPVGLKFFSRLAKETQAA